MLVRFTVIVVNMNVPDIGRQCLYPLLYMVFVPEYMGMGIIKADTEAGMLLHFFSQSSQKLRRIVKHIFHIYG